MPGHIHDDPIPIRKEPPHEGTPHAPRSTRGGGSRSLRVDQPQQGRLLTVSGAASSNPTPWTHGTNPTRDGEATAGDWRYWFMRAHHAWARRRAPWLFEERQR